jgi:adenine deaminase
LDVTAVCECDAQAAAGQQRLDADPARYSGVVVTEFRPPLRSEICPPGSADLVLTSDITSLPIELVIARGVVVARHGRLDADIAPFAYPEAARRTMNMKRALTARDFDVTAPQGRNQVDVRVIGVIENQAPTRALQKTLKVESGLVEMDRVNDVCQIALVERHKATGKVVNAFVSGFGYTRDCALASTVAHDSHHMIVVGTNKDDMAQAANILKDIGGGLVLVSQGSELARVEMPIAGLMSDERAEIVAAKAGKLVAAMKACGCNLNNANMQHSLLALVVIPELRISDEGLIDVTTFQKVDLFV